MDEADRAATEDYLRQLDAEEPSPKRRKRHTAQSNEDDVDELLDDLDEPSSGVVMSATTTGASTGSLDSVPMRDGEGDSRHLEEHEEGLEEDEEDEDEDATAAGSFGIAQDATDANGCALAGVITRIRLRNFMCHDNLEIDFSPNANFVVGKNGSGKSAILSALQIGLGARGRDTQRAKSLQDYVKDGRKEDGAQIVVSLANDGKQRLDGFEGSRYGKVIHIRRRISGKSAPFAVSS
ncbi:MAG: hypothetical protein MHM6MM_009026, partial [Cercozoa sp. M6MM]